MTPRRLAGPAGIEDLLLFRMNRVVGLGGALVTRICEGRFGVTRREWSVLAVAAREEAISWAELRDRCGLDESRVSRAVTSLVAKGLAEKSTLANRQLRVRLTDKGRELYAELFPIAREINAELVAALDPQAVESLDQALVVLHARARQQAAQSDQPKAGRLRGGSRAPGA
jgi:DNA-binding MarR family transcriptional regulator